MGRWNYTLKCGPELRTAVDEGDSSAVLDALLEAYDELCEAGIIDETDREDYKREVFDVIESEGDYEDEEDWEGEIDYQLSGFYDLCDNLRVWVDAGISGSAQSTFSKKPVTCADVRTPSASGFYKIDPVNDEWFVGDSVGGRTYRGIKDTLEAVRFALNAGQPEIIVTLATE